MRTILIAAAALAVAAPAWAQTSSAGQPAPDAGTSQAAQQQSAPAPAASSTPAQRDPRDEELARNMPDKRELEQMGQVLGRLVDALMDVKVGPFVKAVDPDRKMSRRERNQTFGDVATKNDPNARERMRDQIGAATVGLGAMAEAMVEVAPVLRRSLEETSRKVEEAMDDAGRRRGSERNRSAAEDRKNPR